MKSSKLLSLLMLCSLIAVLSFSFPAEANKKKKKEEQAQVAVAPVNPPPAAAPVSPPDTTDYDAVFKQASNQFDAVQALIRSQDYNAAIRSAQALMRDIEIRAGIRSKTPNLIDCGDILDVSDLETSYSDLSPLKQSNLSRLMEQYKSGKFLDLLNIAKRANALYLRAFYLKLASEPGKMTSSDLQFIKEKFLEIQDVKIYFVSKKLQNAVYLAFDSDLLDSKDIYAFNRELLDVVLEDRALNLDPRTLDKVLEEARAKALRDHWNTVEYPPGYQRKTAANPRTN